MIALQEFTELEATVEDLRAKLKTSQLDSIREQPGSNDADASPHISPNDTSASDMGHDMLLDLEVANQSICQLEKQLQSEQKQHEENLKRSNMAATIAAEELKKHIAELQRQVQEQTLVASLVKELADNDDITATVEQLAQAQSRIAELELELSSSNTSQLQDQLSAVHQQLQLATEASAKQKEDIIFLREELVRLKTENDQLLHAGTEALKRAKEAPPSAQVAQFQEELKELELEPVEDIAAVQTSLLTAQADVGRLTLANQKLKDRISKLEKVAGVSPSGQLLQRGMRVFTTASQTDPVIVSSPDAGSSAAQIKALEAELSHAKEQLSALSQDLTQARAQRDKENESLGVNALVLAKTSLQEKCSLLQDELDEARTALEVGKVETERLKAENKSATDRITKLEKAIVKKMPTATGTSCYRHDIASAHIFRWCE